MRISDWSSDVCSSDLTPMRLAMVSQNGGLKVASAPPEGFTNLLDYTVTLHAVGTGGTSIVASCSASSLAAAAIPPCSFRGTASATTGLRLPGVSPTQQGYYLRVFVTPISGRVPHLAQPQSQEY